VNATVRKVAVGAENHIKISQVTNLGRFLVAAKEAGFWIYGAAGDGSTSISELELSERSVLVMGSEGSGIRHGVLSKCDVQVSIPIQKVESLNVSVATSILVWEWARNHGPSSGGKNG
jgi:23S rRNA (guanosine2251-2'-O)-methyltransferase